MAKMPRPPWCSLTDLQGRRGDAQWLSDSSSFGSRSIWLSFQDIQKQAQVRCCVEPNQNRIGHLAEQGGPAGNPCSSTAPLYPENTGGLGWLSFYP